MTVNTGPLHEPVFTMAEMEALSKIKPTPYLDEADLPAYHVWPNSTDSILGLADPALADPRLTDKQRADLNDHWRAWRAAFGLD